MLRRIVRLTLHPDTVQEFLALFDASAPKIRSFDGCEHLELWQDVAFPNIVTTYSHWDSEDALNRYRKSPLFKQTWARTRPLFAAPPQPFSHYPLRSNE